MGHNNSIHNGIKIRNYSKVQNVLKSFDCIFEK